MKPLLVTGFQPFLGETINPSQEILARLESDPSLRASVRTKLLPVAFNDSVTELKRAVADVRPSGLLMLGQAKGRSKISLERVALNWIETAHADETGHKPQAGAILPSAPPAVLSTLPLDEWRSRIEQAGIPAEVSLSAGGYVCNHLLYHAAVAFSGVPLIFVHVPLLPEQAKAGEPSLTLDQMTNAVKVLLTAFSDLRVPGTLFGVTRKGTRYPLTSRSCGWPPRVRRR